MTEKHNAKDYISLEKADEQAFRDQLKQSIFKELFRRDFLTKAQLNQLLDIA